ncbi:hypothetical protein M9H77_34174 [Catharanthus roseus]|uniref:Uncharacterized protein n=1 Tax=Catharanthus roseus TaxID=4058 RepID=A0ACB9ZKI4_CATRO|nr:hypothetical protein M9H77_34174 [Catharanthus roseus]
MDSPNRKCTYKYVKGNSHSGIYSSTAKGLVRHGSPSSSSSQGSRNHSGVPYKPLIKENTKQQEFKLHTQERAVKRALFNYTVATKFYIIEQQKKQLMKLQKMIEEEEVKLLRKEMIPRAQLMPFFDKPFFPQRSTRPLTVPKEPNLLTEKCSSSISRRMNFTFLNTMKPIN